MTEQATTPEVPNSEETKLLIKFPAFRHARTVYDLSHLDPSVVEYIQPGTDTVAAKVYNVNVIYIQHCFTRDIPRSGAYDQTLAHKDGKEVRLFDVDRWELSKRLPGILRALTERTCHHAKENNFVTLKPSLRTSTCWNTTSSSWRPRRCGRASSISSSKALTSESRSKRASE